MISLLRSIERNVCRTIFFDDRSIATIELFHSTSLSNGHTQMPNAHAEMNENVETDQTDEGITIQPSPMRLRTQIFVLIIEKDQCANDRMPTAENDQHKDRDNRVHVDQRQIRDRRLESTPNETNIGQRRENYQRIAHRPTKGDRGEKQRTGDGQAKLSATRKR